MAPYRSVGARPFLARSESPGARLQPRPEHLGRVLTHLRDYYEARKATSLPALTGRCSRALRVIWYRTLWRIVRRGTISGQSAQRQICDSAGRFRRIRCLAYSTASIARTRAFAILGQLDWVCQSSNRSSFCTAAMCRLQVTAGTVRQCRWCCRSPHGRTRQRFPPTELRMRVNPFGPPGLSANSKILSTAFKIRSIMDQCKVSCAGRQ